MAIKECSHLIIINNNFVCSDVCIRWNSGPEWGIERRINGDKRKMEKWNKRQNGRTHERRNTIIT